MNTQQNSQLHKHIVMCWVFISELPKPNTEIIMYREDAGVFFGYYGCLEDCLPEDQKEQLYKDGMTEDSMFDYRFYYMDMSGNGLLELDTLPTHWMELPSIPCC